MHLRMGFKKPEFPSWALAFGSGMITVAITRACSGLGGRVYHTWAGFWHRKGPGSTSAWGFLGGDPRLQKQRHAEPAVPFSCSGKEVLLAAWLISENNRKSVVDCNIFLFSQYCPDDVFLVLIRLSKAWFLWISHHCVKIGLTALWPVHSQILPVASVSINSLGDSSCTGGKNQRCCTAWGFLDGCKSGYAGFQPALVNLTVSRELLQEVCKGTGWWSESLFLSGMLGKWLRQLLSGSTWTRGAWAAFLSLLLIRVCITPTGWTKSRSVKCIY